MKSGEFRTISLGEQSVSYTINLAHAKRSPAYDDALTILRMSPPEGSTEPKGKFLANVFQQGEVTPVQVEDLAKYLASIAYRTKTPREKSDVILSALEILSSAHAYMSVEPSADAQPKSQAGKLMQQLLFAQGLRKRD